MAYWALFPKRDRISPPELEYVPSPDPLLILIIVCVCVFKNRYLFIIQYFHDWSLRNQKPFQIEWQTWTETGITGACRRSSHASFSSGKPYRKNSMVITALCPPASSSSPENNFLSFICWRTCPQLPAAVDCNLSSQTNPFCWRITWLTFYVQSTILKQISKLGEIIAINIYYS